MYGLPQPGILANKLLKERLEIHNYYEVPHTPGLFTHKTRPIWFTLTVDDFGVKFIGRKHAEHLMTVLKKHYKMEENWKGELYCGITLKWNYAKGYVDISIPNYVHKKLTEYEHKSPKHPQNFLYAQPPVKYGKESNLVQHKEISSPTTEEGKICPKGLGKFFILCMCN